MWLVILLVHLNDRLFQLIKFVAIHDGCPLKLVAPSGRPRILLLLLLLCQQRLLMKWVVAASHRRFAEPIRRAEARRARHNPQLVMLLMSAGRSTTSTGDEI